MRDYVRGLLGQAARKNGWQLAEWAGHRTPDGFQRLLNSSVWDADALRHDVRAYVAEQLGPDGVRIAGSRWAIEECFQAAKNECGLDQYEVRDPVTHTLKWSAWRRHRQAVARRCHYRKRSSGHEPLLEY